MSSRGSRAEGQEAEATGAVLEVADLQKTYLGGDGGVIEVLTGVNLALAQGEFVAIVGASGSGKSTLLHLMGALDAPTAGEIRLEGEAYGDLSPDRLAERRNRKIGFVFQFHHLLRDFTAVENVMMPLLVGGVGETESAARASSLLDQVGLRERAKHRPAQLSGGEQQRVAVARALAVHPRVVLADEPSGNLDPANAEMLHELLGGLTRDRGQALVVVTHNRSLAGRADRVLALHNGRLEHPRGDEVMTS